MLFTASWALSLAKNHISRQEEERKVTADMGLTLFLLKGSAVSETWGGVCQALRSGISKFVRAAPVEGKGGADC